VYFGDLYGLAAARGYFGKSASDLDLVVTISPVASSIARSFSATSQA
jgi:hypothetical protein